MMPTNKKAYSKIPPIAKVESLASILSIGEEELLNLSASTNQLWKPGKKLRKKNGDVRLTIDAKPPLKKIHERIKNRILKQVYYPDYLLGGIADPQNPRDYKRNAALHSGKQVLINEDIKDFFPNTTYEVVNRIWKHVFRCNPEVADILASLTTLDGNLPQGWKTSGYLANLVFWDIEPTLVDKLHKRGYIYSRFMDDVTVSSRFRLNNSHKNLIIDEIYHMLFSKGYAPKRTKHNIAARNERMEVTGLTVNSKNPTLPNKDKIRAAVKNCEIHAKHDRTSQKYKSLWNSTSTKVGMLTRFHPGKGKQLRARLRAIKPL